MFRCRSCGRVAPETAWALTARPPRQDALNLRRYPVVRCPLCDSRDIDMNHGVQVDAYPAFRLHDPPMRGEPPSREN